MIFLEFMRISENLVNSAEFDVGQWLHGVGQWLHGVGQWCTRWWHSTGPSSTPGGCTVPDPVVHPVVHPVVARCQMQWYTRWCHGVRCSGTPGRWSRYRYCNTTCTTTHYPGTTTVTPPLPATCRGW